jgi:ribonuclease BN (tRNA processing enzyme)
MQIRFLGTGTGIPQPGRVQSGFIVETRDESLLLFDSGAGVLSRLSESGYDPLAVDAVILSHLHLDHVADVLPLLKSRWLSGNPSCTLFGPEGTRNWLDRLIDLYPYLRDRFDLRVTELKPGDNVRIGECSLSCAAGVHSVPSLAYRLEDKSCTLAYSGDTEPCADIMELAAGCDLLIHECSFPLDFPTDNHTTPDMLAPFLENTDIRRLYLTHLYPHMQGHETETLSYLRERFDGKVDIATDLLTIEI